ncbi:hypothetical protein CABS01_16931 [Colletotrichum abscissum]|uniref:uncharacterized protein n=1 Tax=Colletotrichum abscissum TaxID=1671311 RepID=UPI0027D509AE|nr:uncharacterized protein CABS01_16931 [Colletotrichum abscissum]KAK1503907.1 hypothetical protein CABS01_16931 [Colletotrichum abscissum]
MSRFLSLHVRKMLLSRFSFDRKRTAVLSCTFRYDGHKIAPRNELADDNASAISERYTPVCFLTWSCPPARLGVSWLS